MKTKKRRFRHFHYRECDAFAKYLEEQAVKGWHLKDWRFGLVFEKGEPKEEKYAVEVFPKGDERASRPEKDAEEFAEYCKAAGWGLVDGRRKFCIFRAIRKGAVPIATPDERYENICKAEKERLWMPMLFVFLAWFVIKLLVEGLWKFGFDNSQLFMVILTMLMAFFSVADAIAAFLWRRKRKRQIERGGIPFYGKSFGIWYEWFTFLIIPGVLILQLSTAIHGGISEVLMVLAPFSGVLILGIVGLVSAITRPSVERRVQIHGILAVAVIFVLFCMGGYAAVKGESEATPETYAPLMQENFKEVSGECYIHGEESETFLGKRYEYYISYGKEEVITDQMRYEGYESSCAWVIAHLWKEKEKWEETPISGSTNHSAISERVGCKDLWEAEEAWMYQTGESDIENYCYEVRYIDEVFVLHTMEKLDAEDIRVVREKLELG